MKRAVLLALASLLLCAPAAWGAKAKTTLTIDSAFLATGQTQWAGDIASPRKACKNKRRILIFRVRPGADQKMGSTRSFAGIAQPGYYWTFAKDGAAPSGRYYALAKATKKCKGDRSGTIQGP